MLPLEGAVFSFGGDHLGHDSHRSRTAAKSLEHATATADGTFAQTFASSLGLITIIGQR
jgi:tagatose-1,6-bisphosphate aldolase non-catalytic subunit AgaZ/GatZ